MSKPFFIWTMRRTGGTSLTDLLMKMSEHQEVEHEPFNLDRIFGYMGQDYKNQLLNGDTTKVSFELDRLFLGKPLIKHCYEIIDTNFNKMLIDRLKDTNYKQIFLLRKDEVSRILSLFLAYQTNVWGKHGSEEQYEMIKNGEKTLTPFDMEHVKEEEETAILKTKMVQKLLNQENICYKVVYFEDFFTGEREERLSNLNDLFNYLEFDKKTVEEYKALIEQTIFNKSQKSSSILEYVPNHKEAKSMLENFILDNKKNRINIKLYLGAHKTATTHLQGILMANRSVLLKNNIKLSVPQDIRNKWLPNFFKFCSKDDNSLLPELQAIAPKSGSWVLTEENIVGVSNDFTTLSGMYPKMGERLGCIKKVFKYADIELFFSLRSYDSFYRSAYSEVIRNKGYIPFEEFYDEDRFKNNSWLELVKMLVGVIPQNKITLWCFEDFRALVPKLLKKMTGIPQPEKLIAAYKAETTRPSLSQRTIDILENLYPVLSREESLALVERINKEYAVSSGYTPLSTFNKEQIKSFKDQYVKDIQAIKREFPNINFLKGQNT